MFQVNYLISLFVKGIKNTREKTKALRIYSIDSTPNAKVLGLYEEFHSLLWAICMSEILYCFSSFLLERSYTELDFLLAVEGGKEYGIWRQSWVTPYPQYDGASGLIF